MKDSQVVFFVFFLYCPFLVNNRPIRSLENPAGKRSALTDAVTYALVPVAIVVGTEGAILGATGSTFGDGIQAFGEGIKMFGDEIKDAGGNFTNFSRGLKGISSALYQWGTGGSQIPVIGKDSDVFDSIEILSKISPEISRKALELYFQSLDADDLNDE